MRYLVFLLLLFILPSCVSKYQSAPPPGVERGEIWKLSENYGYDVPIYSTPDLLPQPKKGTQAILKKLQRNLQSNNCSTFKSGRVLFMVVVDENGSVINVHPNPVTGDKCEAKAKSIIKSFEYYPAEYDGNNVKSIFAISTTFR